MDQQTILDAVLDQYPPPFRAATWSPLGSAGGFSGARIWRGTLPDGRSFALKAFSTHFNAQRLDPVHGWMSMARAAGLDFVPTIEQSATRRTTIECEGRCWEITSWMPGSADFHENPSDIKLSAAVTAVARIHEAWKAQSLHSLCPAVFRRWQALCDWEELVRSGWRPRFESIDPVAPHAEAAWNRLPPLIAAARQSMIPWLDRRVPLQPCIGDVWHDHILFEGDRVSGIIDYAAAKIDHVAADLARLLGSLVNGDRARMEAAVKSYSAIRPIADADLIPILDQAGVVASVATWLRRLYLDGEQVADRAAVAMRLAALVKRLR